MRLTLRTLLAYLDGILEPADQAELAKQVETSDNAKELVHRTGDTMRRLRLGAPPVDSATHDANSVAEYLDNTMAPEDVVEFERRCLESDPELAEVASCHQVLKMVLVERADVADDLRQAMYDLPDKQASKAAAAASAAASSAVSASTVSEVPDYLRASRGSLVWRLAPAAAALVVLAAAAVVFAPGGMFDRAKQPPEVAQAAPAEPVKEPEGDAPLVASVDDALVDDAPADDAPVKVAPAGEDVAPDVDAPPAEPVAVAPAAVESAPAAPTQPPAGVQADPAATIEPPAATGASAITESPVPPTVVPEATAPVETIPAVTEALASAETPAGTPTGPLPVGAGGAMGVAPVGLGEAAEPPSAETPADDSTVIDVAPVDVGLVSSSGQVLLRHVEESDSWRRLAIGSDGGLPKVFTGDRLLSLPYYRPVVVLQGMNVILSGATLVEIGPTEQGDRAVVRLIYGRVLLQNLTADAATLAVEVGPRQGTATLKRGAVLAIEAGRRFRSGYDPMVDPPPLTTDYFVPQGGVTWEDADGERVVDNRGKWRTVDAEVGPMEPLTEPIAWLAAESLSGIQRQAATEMEQLLVGGSDAWPQLQVIKDSRRVELQALAAIASLHVGHFGPSINALNDSEQRNVWDQEIAALRSTLSLSPEIARAVRGAILQARGEKYAEDFYRLVVGYRPEQVGETPGERQAGVLRQLIDWLESDQTDFRVLANHNLEEITGRRGVFNPVGPVRSRELAVARFRKRLEDDELLGRSPR